VLGGKVVVLRGVLGDVVQLPVMGIRSASVSGVIGAPNGLPASVNEGPGHGHTPRRPSWSIERWPNISKYCVRCRVAAAASSKVCAKLTPWIDDQALHESAHHGHVAHAISG
jgi:hypothetical protein